MSILLPSLGRAREQAKSVHCLARLREFGNALAAYENVSGGVLPPALWHPTETDLDRPHAEGAAGAVEYGWAESLFTFIYGAEVGLPINYPAQRNVEGKSWQKYYVCEAAGNDGTTSGHFRVYLPAWSAGSYTLDADGVYGDRTMARPERPAQRERIRPVLPIIGDANEQSERGDGVGNDECSYIDAGEANFAGSDGRTNGNRFSDRHYGGTNFLFQDLHARWDARLREDLARDYDLNGVIDIGTTE